MSKGVNVCVFGCTDWSPGPRGRGYSKYLEVSLGNLTKVTRVALQHPSGAGASLARVQGFYLMHSQDGIDWTETPTVSTPTYQK